ncbi:MAG: hypothetical protein GF418_11020 [Chitinivibrionales bacterium]|nr:hypothetical protein [Chitinivibrionales bacterium]MBD3396147.1 hypothetical protein [Chitinivibrionales bacterium]
MHVETTTYSGYKVFRIRDRIVADSDIDDVAKAVEDDLQKGRKKFAISFLPSSYPYSPILGLLTRCHKTAQKHEAAMVVIAPKQEFIDVLLETHLDRIFEICRSEDELRAKG